MSWGFSKASIAFFLPNMHNLPQGIIDEPYKKSAKQKEWEDVFID